MAEQIDPKDHEEVVAEKNKLAQALADAEKAKGVLESGKADLSRRVAAVQKEKDDAMTSRNKLGAQVCVGWVWFCWAGGPDACSLLDLVALLAFFVCAVEGCIYVCSATPSVLFFCS